MSKRISRKDIIRAYNNSLLQVLILFIILFSTSLSGYFLWNWLLTNSIQNKFWVAILTILWIISFIYTPIVYNELMIIDSTKEK